MIKPIVLLLVASACLVLLGQSNGEEQQYHKYSCKHKGSGVRPVWFADTCVPVKWDSSKGDMMPTIERKEIDEKCKRKMAPDLVYFGALDTGISCQILD